MWMCHTRRLARRAVENARPMMEMRTMRVGQVPFPLTPRRAEGVAMKWIVEAARKRKSRGGMGEVERTVETDELRADQATIRAELYGGMNAYAGGDAANVGRRVVLGPNFTRSARQFGRSYQDALALLREHGPPALIGPPLTVVAHSAGEVRTRSASKELSIQKFK